MASESAEYANFANLLKRIVTTPKANFQARHAEEKSVQDWRHTHGMAKTRKRIKPSASPVSVSDAKRP